VTDLVDPIAPYEALAQIIERELAIVPERDFAALAQLTRERAALVRSLPATPPAAARAPLSRCWLLQERVRIEMQRVREQILLELAQVSQAQRTARGYAPAPRSAVRVCASA
jgi:hypothetical protein